jgi:2-polyprenyl-6-methoxyphenol hydroxylase-like FAD-dependent oxidoreductase
VTFRSGTTWRTAPHERDEKGGITIIATGLTGNAARITPGSRIGAGVVVPASDAPDFYAPGTIYMATGRGGYVGLVRLEDDRLDIAAAFDSTFVRSSGGMCEAARLLLNATGWPVPLALDNLPWKGTPALTRTPTAVAGPGWFAVGDAAGYIEPFTGEGMAWAIASAAALAPIAARAMSGWKESFVSEWAAGHRRLVGRRQRTCRWIAHGLRSPIATNIAVRLLSTIPSLARPFVAALNRPPQWSHGFAP